MNTSADGRAMIKRFESCRLTAYQDKGKGRGVWTIGYGHTGLHVRPGLTISQAEAERLFDADVRRSERAVEMRCLGVQLAQPQFDALVSLVFNVGAEAFGQSRMLMHLKASDFDAAATEFDDWVHDDGVRVNGLVVRRSIEKSMFLKGIDYGEV